jgi:hypothetical protein
MQQEQAAQRQIMSLLRQSFTGAAQGQGPAAATTAPSTATAPRATPRPGGGG